MQTQYPLTGLLTQKNREVRDLVLFPPGFS